MADVPKNGSGRLDSWKAIAAYLDRDERTVQRWERDLGLPVRRVPGGRGTSVFALTTEIDAWLTTSRPEARVEPPAAPAPPENAAKPRKTARAAWLAAAALVVIGVLGSWVVYSRTRDLPLQIALTPSAVIATDAQGERWRYAFPRGERVDPPDERRGDPVEIVGGVEPAMITATAWRVRMADQAVRSGELLSLTPRGRLQKAFSFDDELTFAAQNSYQGPWGITDFRVNEAAGDRRIAVAAHHHDWWPGVVTILDSAWRRQGTFVNAGWIERVHWLSRDRLLVAGFSEARDGGMVALLDGNNLDGHSPEEAGGTFDCLSCGAARPLRYVVMPRSEINRLTGSRFNRARLELNGGRIVVRTIEVPFGEVDSADALYELTPSLDVISASFSERYWDVHRALEAEGKLQHAREQCPDRDGPRAIEAWTSADGWHTQKLR